LFPNTLLYCDADNTSQLRTISLIIWNFFPCKAKA
jgi:hypothetical protein